jgi:hypothetical protein
MQRPIYSQKPLADDTKERIPLPRPPRIMSSPPGSPSCHSTPPIYTAGIPPTSRWTKDIMLTVGVQDKFPGLDHGDPAKESLLELFTAPSEFSSVTPPRLLEADIYSLSVNPRSAHFFVQLVNVLYKEEYVHRVITRSAAKGPDTTRGPPRTPTPDFERSPARTPPTPDGPSTCVTRL